ncbi:hypothetical protein BDV96DRAFT_593642 [Lophiotrema nucula]|uniref:Uncharacterized protein n=1 Tax=Lophiotrema nucula TaxID=690887 RepID=A0A6A5ZY16_9PLEO|nr:hypothetical protein BDV96DRAFT_593642 [Lophiotrema nucula]
MSGPSNLPADPVRTDPSGNAPANAPADGAANTSGNISANDDTCCRLPESNNMFRTFHAAILDVFGEHEEKARQHMKQLDEAMTGSTKYDPDKEAEALQQMLIDKTREDLLNLTTLMENTLLKHDYEVREGPPALTSDSSSVSSS